MYYTPKEVAALLKVAEVTIWKWIRTGKIDYIVLPDGRSYRIPETAIQKMKP